MSKEDFIVRGEHADIPSYTLTICDKVHFFIDILLTLLVK